MNTADTLSNCFWCSISQTKKVALGALVGSLLVHALVLASVNAWVNPAPSESKNVIRVIPLGDTSTHVPYKSKRGQK